MFVMAWAARWAALKALGWSGVWRWASNRAGGLATGSWAFAAMAVALLVGGLVVWRWFDPPERTFTEAEIRADRQARVIAALQKAAADKDEIIAARERAAVEAETRARGLEDANEQLRRLAPAASGDAFTDADPWLQRKRQRAAGAKPATRADRR